MHAVVVSVTVNDADAGIEHLRENVVPQVSQAPGFVAGYWVGLEGGGGRAVIVFESEDVARAASERVEPAPGGATTIDSVEVGEVLAHA